MMITETDSISFFATAGRGTETFAANEIRKKIRPREISTRDGKVFFKLSPTLELNIKKILALRSVERVFVGITDYNNSTYITNKRTFLDKLMCNVASRENISNAKMVLAEMLTHNHENCSGDETISKCMNNSSIATSPGHGGHSVPTCLWPQWKNHAGRKAAYVNSCRQELASLKELEILQDLENVQELESLKKLENLQECESFQELDHLKELETLQELESVKDKELESLKELEILEELENVQELERLKKMEILQEFESFQELQHLKELETLQELESLKDKELESLKELEILEELKNVQELERLKKMEILQEFESFQELQHLKELETLQELESLKDKELESLKELENLEELKNVQELERLKKMEILQEFESFQELQHLKELETLQELESLKDKELESLKELEILEELKNVQELERLNKLEILQELESSYFVENGPAKKYRKLSVSRIQTTEVSKHKPESDSNILCDKSSDGVSKIHPGSEYNDLLNYTPEYDRCVDHKSVKQTTVGCSQVRQIGSHCNNNSLPGRVEQINSNLERCCDSDKETVNNHAVGHKCLVHCNPDYKDNQQQIHQHDSMPEDNNDKRNNGPLSFRMSIKCSGKVSRWLNIKKLSRDLGWRVARATGWSVDLRKPQYEVCVHISDDYVTVGVPLTRFPLSRRGYIVDSGLRAPIAWIMSQLCSIKAGDIVLDPMCGKATILIEASSDVKDAWFMGSDRDCSQIDKALQNVNTCSHSGNVSLVQADGLNMPYRDGCLDAVVCDAPFNNKHLLTLAPEMFYRKFIKEIYRVLRPQGCCVLLVSEQFQHVVLSLIQRTVGSQQPAPSSTSEISSQGGLKDVDTHTGHDKTTESVIALTFVSSHYVKLGETHACILVFNKES